MGLLAWILIGFVAGWLAGSIMKGGGYGALGDILLGLVGSIAVATIGAIVFIALARFATGRPVRV